MPTTDPRYGVKLARGVVHELNGRPIRSREDAEAIRAAIETMYGERGEVVTVLATIAQAAPRRPRRSPPPLTRKLLDVLGIVQSCGPVTVRDVAHHLPIGEPHARRALGRLEQLGYVDATYTTGKRGRAYVARRR